MSYSRPVYNAADATWVGTVAYTRPAHSTADATWPSDAVSGYVAVPGPLGVPRVVVNHSVAGRAAVPSMLGAPAVVGSLVYGRVSVPGPLAAPEVLGTSGLTFLARIEVPGPLGVPEVLTVPVPVARALVPGPLGEPAALGLLVHGLAAVPGPLGVPAVLARQPVHGAVLVPGPLGVPQVVGLQPALGFVAVPGPLGAPAVDVFHDFSVAPEVARATVYYACDVVDGAPVVRLPISSWQATLQTGRSNYLQAVVPAVADYVDALTGLSDAAEFVIYRGVRLDDGATIEQEMARAPVTARFDRGPVRYTCTLSGYSTGFVEPEVPVEATDRGLEQVRSVSSGSGGLRVRCAVDWFLRPGQRAVVEGAPFVASYINYYVLMSGRGDAYMDVGERN